MNPFRPSRVDLRAYGARRALRNLLLALVTVVATVQVTAAEVRILAFGDSLTAGYGLPEGKGFVPQLQAWLRANGAPDATVINAGVSGDTTAGGLARIEWALQDDVDAVIVELGANDMLRGLDLAEMAHNLDGILAAIDARDLPALLAGIPAPPNYGKEYARTFKRTFRDLAAKHDAIYVGSFLSGMGKSGNVREVMRLMQPDGLHPTAEGVKLNVEAIGPSVLDLVGRARAGR